MARGPRKHLKRLNAPKNWMLDKLSGVFAPRPSCGPHKLRECLPLIIIIRNRLKYALTYAETKKILYRRFIKVDSKVRTDIKYPVGLMDVISIEKTNQFFRLLYDVKGRFILHKIAKEDINFKLCRVNKLSTGDKGISYIVTHDGRTFRYPDPLIKVNDTIRVDLNESKVIDFIKFDVGVLVMVTAGRNLGRVGVIISKERHQGSFDIIHIRDSTGQTFATRLQNVFVIGKEKQPWISIPKRKGIRLTIMEERTRRLAEKSKQVASSTST